jgi:hypothetical protein
VFDVKPVECSTWQSVDVRSRWLFELCDLQEDRSAVVIRRWGQMEYRYYFSSGTMAFSSLLSANTGLLQ